MARLVTFGAESGSLDQIELVSGSPTISSAQVRTGTYSVYVAGTKMSAAWTLGSNPAEVFVRVGVYPTRIYSSVSQLIGLYDSAGAIQFTLAILDTSCCIAVYRGAYNGTLVGFSLPGVRLNKWNCLELRLLVDGVNGIAQVKRNGELIIDYTGNTQNTANANVGRVEFALNGTQTVYGYYDDIAINDTTGAVNNSWVGRGGIYKSLPSGAGDSTDLTPSAGANWQCVDERPPNDATDYVSSDAVDDYDLYTTAGTSAPAAGDVSAVVLWTRARLSEAGAGNIATVIKPNAAETDSADYALDVSWDYVSTLYEQNPETAAAWTVAEVDAAQIGVKVR